MIEALLNLAVLFTLLALLLRASILLIPSPLVQHWLTAFIRSVVRRLSRGACVLGVYLARRTYYWSLNGVERLARRWNDYWQP